MKHLFLILALSFVNFSFTNEKIEPNSNNLETTPIQPAIKQINKNGLIATIKKYPCEDAGGVAYVTITVDCEGDGVIDYDYAGYTCADYSEALFEQFIASC